MAEKKVETSRTVVEVRAGKMFPNNGRLFADKRRGILFIKMINNSRSHFCWKVRSTDVVEDNVLIHPGDMEFKYAPLTHTGRVYKLVVKSVRKVMYFWLQEPRTNQDAEYCRLINVYLNQTLDPVARKNDPVVQEHLKKITLSKMPFKELFELFESLIIVDIDSDIDLDYVDLVAKELDSRKQFGSQPMSSASVQVREIVQLLHEKKQNDYDVASVMKRLGDDWEKDLNGPMAALARKFVNEDEVRAMKNYQAPPKSSEDTETDTETSQESKQDNDEGESASETDEPGSAAAQQDDDQLEDAAIAKPPELTNLQECMQIFHRIDLDELLNNDDVTIKKWM